MTIYYVYAYLRKDGTPYYIGKGSNDRAWVQHRTKSTNGYYKGIHLPPVDRIVILESNLTSVGAFAIERRMIQWYGRKDNNTGILLNKTNGGEGLDGAIRTDEWKSKISKGHQGKKLLEITKDKLREARKKQLITKETADKIRDTLTGRPRPIVECPHCGSKGGIGSMHRWHFNKCKNY